MRSLLKTTHYGVEFEWPFLTDEYSLPQMTWAGITKGRFDRFPYNGIPIQNRK